MSKLGNARCFALASFVTLASGCANIDFKEPISSFSGTMALSTATLNDYYIQLNSYERQIYLSRVLHQQLEVGEIGADGKPTGLIAQFSPESIRARLDAVRLLTVYGERLAALAGADATQRFNSGAQTLGANLVELGTTFEELKNEGDKTAGSYVPLVASLVGLLGEMYLDRKRDAAITNAVKKGEPAVNKILDLLERDISFVIEPLQSTGMSEELTASMADYNVRKRGMSYEQRKIALAQIESLAAQYEAMITSEPSDVIDGIRDAHASLVTYAKSPRKPNDLASLVAALELLNNRVRPVAQALDDARRAKQ